MTSVRGANEVWHSGRWPFGLGGRRFYEPRRGGARFPRNVRSSPLARPAALRFSTSETRSEQTLRDSAPPPRGTKHWWISCAVPVF